MARPQRYVINLEQARIAQIKRGKRHDVVINATDYLTYLIGKPQCEILGQPQAPGDLKSLMESAVICTKSLNQRAKASMIAVQVFLIDGEQRW